MKTVKSFTTNNLVEGHDIYVKFMNSRFENLKKEGRETEILFYKRGKAGSTLESMSLTRAQRWDIFKWHCMTLSYNIWCDLVKDYTISDKSSILYKKHVDVPEDILKKFKHRVEQSISNARCDYNSKNRKGMFDACRYLAMYWTYLDIIKDCKTQRYFPNAETVVRAQKIFDYARYTNPFFMNGKFRKSAIRDTKETKEMADTTNCIELEDLDFSVRTYNILKRAHVNTLDDILNKTYDDLIHISNMGKHSLNEIVEKLKEQGYEYTNAHDLPQLIKCPNNTDSFDKNKLLIDIIEDRRLTNPLHRASIHTVGDFLSMSDKELLKIRTFGVVKLKKVREAVDKYVKKTKEESVIDIAEQAAKEVEEERKGLDISVHKFKGDPYLHVNVDNRKRIDELNEKLEKTQNVVAHLQTTLNEKNLRIAHLEDAIEGSKKRIDDILEENVKLKNREMELNLVANPKNLDTFALLKTVLEKMSDSKMEYIMLTIDGMVIDIHPRQNFTVRTREAGYGRV